MDCVLKVLVFVVGIVVVVVVAIVVLPRQSSLMSRSGFWVLLIYFCDVVVVVVLGAILSRLMPISIVVIPLVYVVNGPMLKNAINCDGFLLAKLSYAQTYYKL